MKITIETYCTIINNAVKVNGTEVFNQTHVDKDFLKELYQHLIVDYTKFYKMDNISKLGLLGVEILKKADPSLVHFKEDELGVFLQTEKGCLESDVNHQARVEEKSPSPAIFVYTLSNIVIGEISIRNKWFGESALFIEKNADYGTMYQFAKMQLNMNKSQACIIGFIDSFNDRHELGFAVIKKNGKGQEFTEENLNKIFEN